MENAVIKKGWIERSNVDLTQEMSDIIASQRALQTNSQALKMYDMIMDIESNQIGRIN
jgi:flagellar basal-body rod protein FlgG